MSDTYTCYACGGVFKKGWSDEEATAEREQDFPNHTDEEMELVCDDCYKKYSPGKAPKYYEQYKTEHPEYYQ